MEVKFCMTCGSPLTLQEIDGVPRMACSAESCSFVHWGNYSIGVGALVVKNNKVLLVRRAQEPGKGKWTNPGGYVEQTELIHDTIRREVQEEAGVDAVVTGVAALRDQPRAIHNVYVAFTMDYISGEPRPDGVEVDRAGFYSLEEMAQMDVADFTKWLVDIALNRQSEGLQIDENPVVQLAGAGLFKAR